MYSVNILALKVFRKLYVKAFGKYQLPPLQREGDPDKASEMIYNLLASDQPCMIARWGANELNTVVNYLGVNSKSHSIFKYIKGEQPEWWWNKGVMYCMQNNAGFFPSTPGNMQRFGKMMIEDSNEVDLLGSWLNDEYRIYHDCNIHAVMLPLLEPYHASHPWSRVLANKKILVIHPFADLITRQYKKRKLLFKNQDILPDFELDTIQTVQSLGGEANGFKDWFVALEWMKQEMDKRDYDICLIGCGAYGFPLAAHAKRRGKKAVHLGGALQLLFGIKGKRWEDPNYGVKEWGIPYGSYTTLINEYWVRPDDCVRPKNAKQIEGGCYW